MAATAEGNAISPTERHRICRSKKRYDREGKAIEEVIRLRKNGTFGWGQGRVVHCPICRKYHITTSKLTEPVRAAG